MSDQEFDNTSVSMNYPPAVLGVVQPPTVTITGGVAPAAPRVELLRQAAALITGDREQDYGTPQVNFQRIADLWNVQLRPLLAEGRRFTPQDVALAMVQVKLARAVQTPNEDSFKDAAGYIGLAYELSLTADGE